MRCLTNLQQLNIHGVPQVEERCEKDIGADWYKIAHIPSVTHRADIRYFWKAFDKFKKLDAEKEGVIT